MNYLVLLGRIFYSLIFLMAVPFHMSADAIAYAASKEVPFPEITVPLGGVVAGLGALSVLFGFKTRWGAWLLVGFLVPVTYMMHQFWTIEDPMTAAMQQSMFFKNLSMLGAALFFARMGAGPLSLDARKK